MALYLGIAALAGVLAAVLPARRAAQGSIVAALADA
jgi:ABC-type antimicrobial peptide transport system permease subunit